MTKHRRIVGLVTIALVTAAAAASAIRSPSQSSLANSTSGSGTVRLLEPVLTCDTNNDDALLPARVQLSIKPARYEAVIANWKRHRETHSSK
jgi:hypothetical protein